MGKALINKGTVQVAQMNEAGRGRSQPCDNPVFSPGRVEGLVVLRSLIYVWKQKFRQLVVVHHFFLSWVYILLCCKGSQSRLNYNIKKPGMTLQVRGEMHLKKAVM